MLAWRKLASRVCPRKRIDNIAGEESVGQLFGLVHQTAHITFVGAPIPSRRSQRKVVKPTDAPLRRQDSGEPVAPFIAWVFERVNLNPSVYRSSCLNRRLNACLRRLRVSTTEAAQKLLESRPELLHAALDSLLLGVSEFFRDAEVFTYFREKVLPAMFERSERIRILSIGVSEGYELYSVAMLLAEMNALDRVELVGMDCRPEAIRHAREGWFSERDMGGVSEELRSRYFSPEQRGWVAKENIRSKIQWSVGNVLNLDGVGQSDIIFFRNLAIYLTGHHADCAWSALFGKLSPNGMLVCGKADKPPASLHLTRIASCIYEKSRIVEL